MKNAHNGIFHPYLKSSDFENSNFESSNFESSKRAFKEKC